MTVEIKAGRAEGIMTAPPSKSAAHRMLVCAGLSKGESVIGNVAPSRDMTATMDCLKAMGADVCYDGYTARINGIDFEKTKEATFDCGECGTTLRFFLPICLLTGKKMTLKGSERLFSRPMSVYEKICSDNGFLYEKGKNSVTVCGKLESGEYSVAGNISSQFISGLMLALPLTGGESVINIIPPVESKPYIDLTEDIIKRFGITEQYSDNKIKISGKSEYLPQNALVEGDHSNAAFFEALNLVGGRVTVEGLSPESLQGDKIYKEYFEKLKNGYDVMDLSDCPDLGPVLMAVAAALNGGYFTGTRRLKIKESDRCEAMAEELLKFGVKTEISENSMKIYGGMLQKPDKILSGHNDHRIVMALSVLLTLTGGKIEGAQAVEKSLPDFFERLQNLKIEVNKNGMDK